MTRRNIYIGAGLLAATAALVAFICFGRKETSGTQKPGPEEVLVTFIDAMKAGDFDKAKSKCDTAAMQEYLDAYMHKWEEKIQKDSTASASIISILAETAIKTDNVENMDGACFIDYTLILDGNTRKCHAGLKKEEGEWKVAEITGAI